MTKPGAPSSQHRRVITPASPTAFERWELPSMEDQGGGAPPRRQRAPGMVTACQVEELQSQAYEEGFAEGKKRGFEKGYADGLAAGHAEVRVRAETLQAALHGLARPMEALDEEVEASLVALSVAIARQFVRRELKMDPGQVVAVVREAISALPVSARAVRLYLNPQDVPVVREAFSLEGDNPPWEVLEDPVLTRGGCRVDSESSRIDASVESHLASVIAHVLGGEREND